MSRLLYQHHHTHPQGNGFTFTARGSASCQAVQGKSCPVPCSGSCKTLLVALTPGQAYGRGCACSPNPSAGWSHQLQAAPRQARSWPDAGRGADRGGFLPPPSRRAPGLRPRCKRRAGRTALLLRKNDSVPATVHGWESGKGYPPSPRYPLQRDSWRRWALIIAMNAAQIVEIGLSGHFFCSNFLVSSGFEHKESK